MYIEDQKVLIISLIWLNDFFIFDFEERLKHKYTCHGHGVSPYNFKATLFIIRTLNEIFILIKNTCTVPETQKKNETHGNILF